MCIGLQWSKIFYAEFIVPPKPGINKRGQRGQRKHPPYTPYSTGNSSLLFKTTRLRVRPSPNQAKRRQRNQINVTRIFQKKRWSDSLFPRKRRLISLQYSGMLSISLRAFIAFRPTCFARRLVKRNLHETSTQRAR